MDIRQARQLAQDENTTPEKLEKLARNKDYQTRKYVAGNPNTPVIVLEKLGAEFPEEITNNPIFYLLLLENPESEFVRLSLARSSTTEPKTLVKLAESNDFNLLYAIAGNLNTPLDILEKLSEILSLQVGIAANPQTPLSILKKLASSKNYVVRQAVARNKSVSSEILEILARDRDLRVLLAITQNPHTPTSILEIVAATEESIVRDSLLKHPNFTDSVLNIIKFIDGTARPNPSTLEKLAKNPHLKIRRMVADYMNTPANILRQLAREDDSTILECITIHPNFSVDTLKGIASRLIEYSRLNQIIQTKSKLRPNKYVLSKCYRNLIENNQVELSIKMQLVDLISSINYRGVLSQLAQSNFVEPDILLQITESCTIYSNILKPWLYLANNFNTPNQALEIIYRELSKNEASYTDRNQVSKIYKALYHHQNTPLIIKKEIAENKKVSEYSIASNPITFQKVLRELSKKRAHSIRLYVINNPSTPADVFEYFIQNNKMTSDVARCKNTPIPILEMLAAKKGIYLKTELAENPNLPVPILENLAKESKDKIRASVARNPSTPAHILDFLAKDLSPRVRFMAVQNKNLSNTTMAKIINRNSEFYKEFPPGLRERISESYKEGLSLLRENNLINDSNFSQSSYLEAISQDYSLMIGTIGETHQEIQLALLERILVDGSDFSQSLSLEAISQYYSLSIMQKIAQNKNIAPIYLDYLAFNIPTKPDLNPNVCLPTLQVHIADNINASMETLEKLATSSDTEIQEKARKTLKIKYSVSSLQKLNS
ncbi:hypothetical protein H1P_6390003 [Hyella patelloides LEGE 07179]|uniref:Leucine rich repeat variant n=1 Tax=Hyella patelloides LEGE 07179 TaxID=945734 RepID=A0A563W268_9CYAN|nr:hypothetical protein [Hyella patelloides]VEP17727.1 hypothetical protein H1P_6390003 [Hyella patelloides LEGE 07179]